MSGGGGEGKGGRGGVGGGGLWAGEEEDERGVRESGSVIGSTKIRPTGDG